MKEVDDMLKIAKVTNIITEVENVMGGYKYIKSRDLTSNPADWYLKVVMAYSEKKKEWVVWLYNAEFNGLFEGYYTHSEVYAETKYLNK